MTIGKTLKTVFSAVWAGIDGLRKILHLLLLLFIFALVFGALSATAPVLPSKAALLIKPVGSLVEELEGDPYDRAVAQLFGETIPQTLVRDVVDGIGYAKDDDRIQGIVLDLNSIGGTGLTQLQRVGVALDDFRSSGKPVVAIADFYGQGAYYLASHADEVYMHPEGATLLRGFGAYRNYYKEAIDKLRIDWNVFRVGTHKSAVEPYMRDDMSDEDRESTGRLVDELWARYEDDVLQARDLAPGALDDMLGDLVGQLRSVDGDLGELALKLGLVDSLVTRDEFNDRVVEFAGTDPKDDETYSAASLDDYLANMRLIDGDTARDENVAVVVAAGEILNGTQPPGTIGGDSTAELLRRARVDDSVKAVVLRVDSPGGSAFASEVILDEIERLKKADKPVVASMSSVAASGGYWISMAADRIYASDMTITGSIGIFGMFPTFQRTLDAIGVHTDGVASTAWAGAFRPDRPLSDDAKTVFQLVIDRGYDDFISRVADYRGMDKDAVDRIAQGQVWSGSDALERGLVDEIGGLDEAVAGAADLAGLKEGEYGRVYIQKELSAAERLALELFGGLQSLGIDIGALVDRTSTLERLAGLVEDALGSASRFDDPQGIYSYCFCDLH